MAKNIALIMMGGIGSRCKNIIPKQFIKINNIPIFYYLLNGLNELKEIDNIIIVVNSNWINYTSEVCRKLPKSKIVDIVSGGASRSESVLNGLKATKNIANDDDIVMLFDATHPYVDPKGIKELILAVKTFGGATLGQRQYDTCYRINNNDMLEEVIPRQEIVSGASPEAFLFKTIFNIYENSSKEELEKMTSAGALALAHNIPMKICTLNNINLKITYPEDVEILQHLITYNFKEELKI